MIARSRNWRDRALALAAPAGVGLSLLILVGMLVLLLLLAAPAWQRAEIELSLPSAPPGEARAVLRAALPDQPGILSIGAVAMVRQALAAGQARLWVPLTSDADRYLKGHDDGRLVPAQRAWLDGQRAAGRIVLRFHDSFFTAGDSREPELAGIGAGLVGTVLTVLLCMLLALPLGVAGAVYLEELAPRNHLTALIEATVNNLAAVPSIIFGLLGAALFLHWFGWPRSTPLVGGMVLALMSLPIIVIATRASLRGVPSSMRQAALALGATPLQAIAHHALPYALPGILSGTILALAHAIGETAPLLLVGMVAFIVQVPQGWLDAATVLPVQIFLWADRPERGFLPLTAAAIVVLVALMLILNGLAFWLRQVWRYRW